VSNTLLSGSRQKLLTRSGAVPERRAASLGNVAENP